MASTNKTKTVTASLDDDDMEAYLLEHNNDNAENNMVHDSTDGDLYGGDYYFSSAAAGAVRGGRKGEDSDGPSHASRASEKVELVLNAAVMHPLFFELGHDFPPAPPPGQQQQKHEAEEEEDRLSWQQRQPQAPATDEGAVAAALLWAQTNKQAAENDIIIPVVSSTCAMAQQASRGSTALLDLRKAMERERINRQTMDTSQSDLAKLMRKDASGKEAGPAVGDASADTVFAAVGDHGGATAAEEDEAEAELIQRKIRMETKRLEQQQQQQQQGRARQQPPQQERGQREEDVASAELLAMFPVKKHQKQQQRGQDGDDDAMLEDARDDERDARAKEMKAQQIRAQQQSLPIYNCREELLRLIGENPVLVLVGETGSGKTTQLVQYLYHHGYAGRPQPPSQQGEGGEEEDPSTSFSSVKLIGCSQPRRLAAMGVARRVSEEVQLTCPRSEAALLGSRALSELVGYAIYLDDTTTPHTRIKFMTDGVLLREVMKDPLLLKYSVIILDEAHERSIDTDVLMGVLKSTIARRSDFKLIVTSATMDIKKFSAFYGHCPTYTIPGKTFEVQVQYSPTAVMDYVADAVFRVCQLHVTRPLAGKQDILVFMTGKDDVYGTCELIKRRLAELNPQYLETLIVLPCLSEASSQQHYYNSSSSRSSNMAAGKGRAEVGVLDPTPEGMRKCVVATNVAETSLTIDGVRYVVDCGFMKATVFRPKIGMNTLQRYPVSQAQAGQRKGRAGRTTEGVCYRLYTEDQFDYELIPNSIPEIQRSSVDSVVLLLKSIGVQKLLQFDFMDPPPHATTRNSMWLCWSLGLLDDRGAITEAGRTALEFPMSPVLATLLLESTRQHCSVEVVKLVAMITADPKNLFELPKGKEETARQQHGRFFVNDSDHLTLLNVLSRFLENNKSAQWARDHFLHAPTLLRACEVLERLLERMRRLRLPLVSCGLADLDKVRYCLALCFCLQAAQRSDANWNTYRPLLNMGLHCTLHPSSAICAKAEMPPFVVYNELLFVTKEYMVMVTAVEPEWLAEAGRGMYQLRRGKVVVPVVPKLAPEHQEKQQQAQEKAKAADASRKPVQAVVPTASTTTPTAAAPNSSSSHNSSARPPAPHLPKSKFSSLASGKRRGNV